MGNSNSSVNVASVLMSLRSSERASDEVLEALLGVSLTAAELQRALPLSTVRELRHCYTANFALLLYSCIRHVVHVAALRARAETQPLVLTHEQLGRLLTALQLLQRLLPVAHEDGNTPLSPPTPSTTTPPPAAAATAAAAEGTTTTTAANDVPSPRTRATLHFTRLFFVEGRTCDDSAPDATFPLLPCQRKHDATDDTTDTALTEATTTTTEQHTDDTTTSDAAAAADAAAPHRTLGASLVWALVECCFVRGLTLPSTPSGAVGGTTTAAAAAGDEATTTSTRTASRLSLAHPDVYEDLLWYGGVGNVDPFVYGGDGSSKGSSKSSSLTSYTPVTPSLPSSAHRVRAELLATLLNALAAPLYHPSAASYRDGVFSEALLSTAVVPLAPTLAVSMLNTILRYNPYGTIPYMSHFVSSEEGVVVGSARVLVAALSCRGIQVPQPAADVDVTAAAAAAAMAASSSSNDAVSATPQPDERDASVTDAATAPASSQAAATGATTTTATTATTTMCWVHSIRKVISELTLTEAKYIIERLKTMVTLKTFAETTFLPDSQRRFECYDEFMQLLWHLVALSYAVHSQLCSSPHVLDYLAPLLRYGLEVRYSTGLVNQLQTVLFVLLRLSEQRSFAVQCNRPCKVVATYPLPVLPAGSTYHDLIVLSLGLVLGTHEAMLRTLLQPCAVIVSNLAPYMTALGAAASTRLVVTFAQFATRVLDAEARRGGNNGSGSDKADEQGIEQASRSTTSMQNNSGSGDIITDDEVVMVYTCEAIASLLQYHESGAHYLLAALVDYRDTVRRVRATYAPPQQASATATDASGRRRSSSSNSNTAAARMTLPLLITTLDLAVSAALPYVESVTDATTATTPPAATPTAKDVSTATTSAASEDATTTSTTGNNSTATAGNAPRVDAPTVVNAAAMEKLRMLTLVGMLPTPHRIITKLFRVTASTEQWAQMAFWTSMYMYSRNNAFGDAAAARMLHFA